MRIGSIPPEIDDQNAEYRAGYKRDQDVQQTAHHHGRPGGKDNRGERPAGFRDQLAGDGSCAGSYQSGGEQTEYGPPDQPPGARATVTGSEITTLFQRLGSTRIPKEDKRERIGPAEDKPGQDDDQRDHDNPNQDGGQIELPRSLGEVVVDVEVGE
jgi:hypothetical protein